MLRGADEDLPPRFAALARFAVALSARPWALPPSAVGDLVEHGLDERQIEAAAGVVAVFNYLNCVADATGIEYDYNSALPSLEVDHERPAPVRPSRESWPLVAADRRGFSRFTAARQAWQQWHEYVFESAEPLGHRERQLLARAAAEESCDRWRADALSDYEPKDETESTLVQFGRKLSREPWQMRPADLDLLRAAGYSEGAILHAIAVVAVQNADSRLAMAMAAARP